MANAKPVIGWTDNLSNHLQNYATTAYAVSKMRAGRTPIDERGVAITDVNKLFRAGLFFMPAGASHTTDDSTVSGADILIYNLIQDPDETATGGHAKDSGSDSGIWHKSVGVTIRQIQYGCGVNADAVTTRIGTRDAAIANLDRSSYVVIPTVQKISTTLETAAYIGRVNAYAYVKDIAMWIRYTVANVSGSASLTWQPAVTWSLWKPISGDFPVVQIEDPRSFTAEISTRYVISADGCVITLPVAASCAVNSKIIVDQWKGRGKVKAVDNHGTTIAEVDTHPAVANYGLTDITLTGDTELMPDNLTWFKQTGKEWSRTVYLYYTEEAGQRVEHIVPEVPTDVTLYYTIQYLLKRVAFKKKDSDVSVPYRYAIYKSVSNESGSKLVRVCYQDTEFPHNDNLDWYKPVEFDDPAQVTVDSIPGYSVKKNTVFSPYMPDENILGATSYIFCVQPGAESGEKIWTMERCSDIESYLNRLNETVSDQIQTNTNDIDTLRSNINDVGNQVGELRRELSIERSIDITTEVNIYGDNAHKIGEELIIYDPDKFIDPDLITTSSYIVDYFMAKITPVYRLTPYNSQKRYLYLPTKAKAMVGKKIKLVLEPGCEIDVIDDNSERTKTYTFTCINDGSGNRNNFKTVELVLEQYVKTSTASTIEYGFIWIFTTRLVNDNAGGDISDEVREAIDTAVANHNDNLAAHSGVVSSFKQHVNNDVIHITAAERERWNSGGQSIDSATVSSIASTVASRIVSAHNVNASAHSANISSAVVDVLDNVLTSRSW